MNRISDAELEKLLYATAEKENPFSITTIARVLELPKYCYARNIKEKIGLSPAQIGHFIAGHPDFAKCNMTNKYGALWECLSLKRHTATKTTRMTEDEVVEMLKKVSEQFDPFDFCDICLYYGVGRTSNGIAELASKYGLTPARVGFIISRHDEFERFTKGTSSPNRMKWHYKGE